MISLHLPRRRSSVLRYISLPWFSTLHAHVTTSTSLRVLTFLGHLLRGDLVNPVKMFVRPYVRTFTIKHNAATISEIVVFVKVDETFTMI